MRLAAGSSQVKMTKNKGIPPWRKASVCGDINNQSVQGSFNVDITQFARFAF
jgi:hypothetical protein